MRQEIVDFQDSLLEEVAASELLRHAREISRYVRLSGSRDEGKALTYVKERLGEAGLDVHEHRFDSYVSYPGRGELRIGDPTGRSFHGAPPAMSKPTPRGGLKAELVYAEAASRRVEGKLVLIRGLASPMVARALEDKGAAGVAFSGGRHPHEGIVSVVWGTPTPTNASLLPGIPAISLTESDGRQLRELLEHGPLEVVLRTEVDNRWKRIPVVTGDIHGSSPDFVLFSGHIDSWHQGAMDNATGNAAMIEIARLMAERRPLMRRGLRVAFWSGHSHGRYSGSAWYADNFWRELRERCVAHVNIDSIGAVGATDLSHPQAMAEAEGLVTSAIKRAAGKKSKARRVLRAGDQSFWGIGITSILVELSEQPRRTKEIDLQPWGWWWHTPHDTMSRVDSKNLVRDSRVYALVVSELCWRGVLPFDFAAAANEIKFRLQEYADAAGSAFDLSPLVGEVASLESLFLRFGREVKRVESTLGNRGKMPLDTAVKVDHINEALKSIGRALVPVSYTASGSFGQDPAVPLPAVPSLQGALILRGQTLGPDERRFLVAGLRKGANQLEAALADARGSAENCMTRLRNSGSKAATR
ncbi:MAG: M28 family peptidase [Thaumarchaeota archaeon]|nr:M28 family peptidase [Nitrososphaerota archaeon]